MSPDFTLQKFRSLCSAIAGNYPTLTLAEYFSGKEPPERFAIMRHDIDRKPGNVLNTTRIGAESGIKGGMSISFYKIYNHDHIDR